jgi:hypothetical protein
VDGGDPILFQRVGMEAWALRMKMKGITERTSGKGPVRISCTGDYTFGNAARGKGEVEDNLIYLWVSGGGLVRMKL